MRLVGAAVFVSILFVNSAFAGDTPEAFAEIDALIERSVDRGRVPGVSVAVIQDGEVVWAAGYGAAQLDTNTAATADTPYILASVSKPLTATGLMVLVDRGEVSLDEPVNTYLGEGQVVARVGATDAMTVRRLANHTSGMPTHWDFFYEPNMPPPMDETIARYGFAAWAPGTRTNYSNLAFGILNHVTERVSGVPWGTFMESEVYDPAGMTHTSHRIRPGLEEVAAHSYTKDVAGRWVRVTPYAFDHPGASAIWSSAHDLARFLLLHMNGGAIGGTRILSEAAANEMQIVHQDARTANSSYGVAWNISTVNGVKQIVHSGGMPGVRTLIAAYPELGAGYVVLTNADGHNIVSRVAAELRKVLLPPTSEEGHTTDQTGDNESMKAVSGEWNGQVYDGGELVPLQLRFRDENKVLVRLGEAGSLSKKTTANYNADRLLIGFPGRFGAYPHFHGETGLELELLRDGDRLLGAFYVTAPGYFRLPYFAELARTSE
jgi:CubicO group peptidase (beta-lactamase class C family)